LQRREIYTGKVKTWANGRLFVLGYERVTGERGSLTCEVCGSRRPTVLNVIYEVVDRREYEIPLGSLPPMRHCDPSPIFVGTCCCKALGDLGILRRHRIAYDFPLEGARETWKQRYGQNPSGENGQEAMKEASDDIPN